MLREAEQMIRPLKEVFDQRSIEKLRSNGVKGVILVEASIDELTDIAEREGYDGEWVDPHPDSVWRQRGIGMYWFYPKENGGSAVVFYTKTLPNGKAVYILDDEAERFKELFVKR